MISLLSGQIIKISGPQFWKDKNYETSKSGIKNDPPGLDSVRPDYCLTGQLWAVIFSSFLAAGEVTPL